MKRLNYLFHTLLQITGYFFYLIPKIRNLKLLLNPKLGWNQVLKSNFNIIRAEVMNYLVLVEQKKFSEYYDHYSFNELDSWKFNHLFFEGKYNYEALKYTPNLANNINYITNLDKSIIHVSLSILEPKTSIHRHYDTNPLKLRYHLPLIIEGNGKCIFIVNDKEWEIKENEDFVFNEFEYHSVKNTLEKARVHLMIDYFHPVIQGENMLNTVRFIAHQIPIVKTTLRNHPNEPKIYSQLLSPTFPGKISELCFYKDYYLVVPRKTLQLQRLVESKDLCILKSLSTEERYFFLNLIVLLHYLNKNNGYVYSMLNTARFNNIFCWANHFNMEVWRS